VRLGLSGIKDKGGYDLFGLSKGLVESRIVIDPQVASKQE
jgi:hypothetical protein